jgi:hypothetical protein
MMQQVQLSIGKPWGVGKETDLTRLPPAAAPGVTEARKVPKMQSSWAYQRMPSG